MHTEQSIRPVGVTGHGLLFGVINGVGFAWYITLLLAVWNFFDTWVDNQNGFEYKSPVDMTLITLAIFGFFSTMIAVPVGAIIGFVMGSVLDRTNSTQAAPKAFAALVALLLLPIGVGIARSQLDGPLARIAIIGLAVLFVSVGAAMSYWTGTKFAKRMAT